MSLCMVLLGGNPQRSGGAAAQRAKRGGSPPDPPRNQAEHPGSGPLGGGSHDSCQCVTRRTGLMHVRIFTHGRTRPAAASRTWAATQVGEQRGADARLPHPPTRRNRRVATGRRTWRAPRPTPPDHRGTRPARRRSGRVAGSGATSRGRTWPSAQNTTGSAGRHAISSEHPHTITGWAAVVAGRATTARTRAASTRDRVD